MAEVGKVPRDDSRARITIVSLCANRIAEAAAVAAVFLLALLHVLEPEYDPAWRMISEYANGTYGWVLSLMFACWGLSSVALVVGIWDQNETARFRLGLFFLFLGGLGEIGGALFDINNPLHNAVEVPGVLGLPVAALLLTSALGRSLEWSRTRGLLRWLAHLPWASFALFILSFGVMILSFSLAGIAMNPKAGPTPHAPSGVIGYVGLTGRLSMVVYCVWVGIVAHRTIKLTRGEG